ncbi:MAG: polyprenyl synthetase family protein [Dehalococcoidales bacterium]|nr:polyprenyl synthetase family protein [Dehalococcoidales bacterium]
MLLDNIYSPIASDLVRVEAMVRAVSRPDFSWLPQEQATGIQGDGGLVRLLSHSLINGGKRIRPALTLLSGKFHDYQLECLLPMAVAIEIMHTATLVHDDAIDKSAVRRGRPTINTVWDDEKAVLLGDYLFAKAGELVTRTGSIRAIRLLHQTLMVISTGEINQSFNAFNLKQTRQHYLWRISSKTASLFSLSTESGAILSEAPEASIEVLREYGYNLGVAFQIVDDILDFVGTEAELGKPVGSDLAQGTLTLPAMLLLERYPEDNPVREWFQYRSDRGLMGRAIELVRNSPIVDECYALAADYCSRACRDLNRLPDHASRQSLKDLADYVVARRR